MFIIKCQFCETTVERVHNIPIATCFDCKAERQRKTQKLRFAAQRSRRKSNLAGEREKWIKEHSLPS